MPLPLKKGDIAMKYFPGSTRHAATNRLSAWIARCPQLCQALAATGYRPTQRILTVRQARLLAEYLGDP